MRSFYLVALLSVLGLALTPYALLEKEAPKRFAGKTVVYDIYATKINSIDPATCGDVASSSIQGNFYEGLYTYHYLKRDRPLAVIPQLAESLPTISPDGLVYTIPLKPNVRYSRNPCFGREADGRPKTRTMRADDFVLAFKRIGDFHITTRLSLSFIEDKIAGLKEYRLATRRYAKGEFSRYDRQDLPGVKALDAHTLQIRLVKRFPQLLYVLAMSEYAPVPREVIDYHLSTEEGPGGRRVPLPVRERDPEIRQREAVVGTGPYVLAEWVRAGKIVLERNGEFRDDYYPTQGAPGDREAGLLDDAGKKVPFVDVWYLTFVSETNPQWMLFLERQRDIGGIPRDVFEDVISPDRELIDDMAGKGIRLIRYTVPVVYWFAFNLRDPALGASKSLRQALCLCYDAESHIDVLNNGRGRRALTVVPSTFLGYEEASGAVHGPYYWRDLGGPRQALAEARRARSAVAKAVREGQAGRDALGAAEAGVRAARDDLAQAHKREQARALAAAKAKLQQARKELHAAGVLKADEPLGDLTLDLGSRDETARRLGEFARGQLKQLGINLKVNLNDWPTLQQKVNNKQVQMYFMGWHADYTDPENFLQLFYSPNISRGTNDMNYQNPRFDELYERAAVIMNESDRVPLYVRMLRMVNEDCPCLPVSQPEDFLLVHPWVYNVKPHPVGYGLEKYRRIDPDLRRRLGGR